MEGIGGEGTVCTAGRVAWTCATVPLAAHVMSSPPTFLTACPPVYSAADAPGLEVLGPDGKALPLSDAQLTLHPPDLFGRSRALSKSAEALFARL